MRRLLLFRHAKAERSIPGGADRDRVLVEHGRNEAARIGAYISIHNLVPDRVLISPAARAQQTWNAASAAFKTRPATVIAERLYDATPHVILALIGEVRRAAPTLLIVGHNPGLQELALMLVASGDIETREQLREKLPTSGLAIIDFACDDWSRLHPQSGRLERLVSPRSLEAAAG